MKKTRYFWKGNELYNIKWLKRDIMFHDIMADWKDKDDGNKEKKRGKFYLKELEIIEN